MKPELICLILIGVIPLAIAQQPVVSAPQKTISSYMGLHTFPATNQTPAQQQLQTVPWLERLFSPTPYHVTAANSLWSIGSRRLSDLR